MPIALPQTLRHFITNVPLRWALTVAFMLPTIGAAGLVGYLSYRSEQEAVEDLGHQLVAETNERVTQELKTYLQTPLLINRLNVDAVNQRQLDPQNAPALEAALFNRLQQFDQVSAILFASPQGTFRVVERLSNLYLGVAAPPHSDKLLVYHLDSYGRREQLVHTENGLDVRRDRPLYRRAVTTGKLGWNPISQYGSFKLLTLDASQPVYDPTTKHLLGVFAVHIRLDYLSEFLHRLDISRFGRVIIMDQSSALIATSTREQPYKFVAGTGYHRQFKQLNIYESHDGLTRSLGEYLRDRPGTLKSLEQPKYLEFSYNGELQYVEITPFQDQYGLNWQILTVIPKSHFLKAIQDNTRTTALLCLLTLGAAIALGLLAANRLTARFAQLNRVSRELAAGNLDQRLPTDSPIYELNGLAQTFNQMADQLQQSFDRLKTSLAESEEKFTIIFHSSPDPIVLGTMAEGRCVEANESFLDLLEYSREELIGQRFLDLGVWGDLNERAHLRQALQQQGHVRNLEVRLGTRTGQIKTVLLSAELIEINDETYVLGIIRDISERKQLEQSLRSQAEEEHLLATITQNIRQSLKLEQILATTVIEIQQTLNADRVLIFQLHPDGSGRVIQEAVVPEYPVTDQIRWEDEHFPEDCYEYYQQGNPRIVADVATDEWAGCLIEFMQEVGVKSKVVAPIVQASEESSVKVWGLLIVHACSHYRQWQESEANFLQQICNQLAIAIDQANLYQQLQLELAERRQAEEALRQSKERFRRAFDDAPIGIALISVEGRFLKVNRSLCDIVGYTEAELLTRNLQDITCANDWQACLGGMQQMLADKMPVFQMEKRYLQKQGNTVQCSLNVSLVKDWKNQPLYFVGQIQDISVRLKVERMKDEFISVVSHELRTPITSIRGALGILGSGVFKNRPQKAQHMLHIAINNSDRLVRLVDDILSLERLESGKVQLVMQHCQVTDLMQQAVDSVQAIADQSAVTLSFTPLAVTLRAAPDAIIQMLTNLLSNAIKFSPGGSTVWLKAELPREDEGMSKEAPTLPPSHPHILFIIKDQGRGIPQDKIEVIFEQFQQVDVSDSRKKGGTGLGLAICKSIVRQHGGQIWAESSLGTGSTFYVALPLTSFSVLQNRGQS